MPDSRPSAPAAKKPPKTAAQKAQAIQQTAYYQANKDRLKAARRARYKAKSPAEKMLLAWRSAARPMAPRREPKTANDFRRAALARAFCEWSDLDQVVRTYTAAAVMSELTGQAYVVDHAVPLQNPLVCGLHTHTNLQVITYDENRRKGHWIWPQMWPISEETLDFLDQIG